MIYRFAFKNMCCRRWLPAACGLVVYLLLSVPAVCGAANSQNIALSYAPQNPGMSDTITIGIDYGTGTGDNTLPGIGINVHFDSASLNYTGFNADTFFADGDVVMKPDYPGVQADTENLDNDTTTDKFIPLRWASFEGNWPGTPLPVRLADLMFTPLAVGPTCVHVSVVDTAAGYTGTSSSACFEIACPAPVITRFEVDAETIVSGGEAVLSWGTTGASRASIDNGIGEVTPAAGGSISVHPDRTTVYTLTADNDCGTVTGTVTVTVESDPTSDRPTLLSPADGATGVSLMPELRVAAATGAHVKTRWQIAYDQPRFESDFVVYDEISADHLSRIIVPPDMLLQKGARYHWRVMFYDGVQWSQPSPVYAFQTIGAGPVYVDGIRSESRLDPEETVKLGTLFVTDTGAPVNTDTIKVFRSAVRPEVQIGLKTVGATIEKCGAVHPDAFSDSAKSVSDLPLGLIEFYLNVPGKGESAEVFLYFSEALDADFVWWKYDPNRDGYYNFGAESPEGTLQVSPDRMSVRIVQQDGGHGDLIANPDGRIIDPIGPGGASTGGGGGGGGSCFVRTLCH